MQKNDNNNLKWKLECQRKAMKRLCVGILGSMSSFWVELVEIV